MGEIGGKSMRAPRVYRDVQDLEAMQDVLVKGRQADNGSYYVHIGDLKWWLFYPPLEGEFWDQIYMWDDPQQSRRLLGWALISPAWVAIDVYVQPELRGSEAATEMYLWAEQEATRVARENGKKAIASLWVRHDDEVLKQHFIGQGFRLKQGTLHFTRSLEGSLPEAALAPGYKLRGCTGLPEVTARAKAQYGAFNSSANFERYLERFIHFMGSPAYKPELDVVASAPDGQIGAFCIVWLDPVNKVGLFEPVGSHPDFQRKGLGRAVMLEGFRRLKKRGMTHAIVSTSEDNQAGVKLYEALGLQLLYRLGTYEKEV
jgi:mycothiol synthase